jgi:hypothetical protein
MRRPSASEVLGGILEQLSGSLHVACPAEVTRWNVTTQQVDAQPLVKSAYLDEAGERVAVGLPVVCNVPVVSPHAPGLAALKTYLDSLRTALAAVTVSVAAPPGNTGTLVWSAPLPSVPAFTDLVLPVSVGDTGLLVFADGSLDVWLARGGVVDPLDDRHHALSDAVFIPGLRPFSNPISVPA